MAFKENQNLVKKNNKIRFNKVLIRTLSSKANNKASNKITRDILSIYGYNKNRKKYNKKFGFLNRLTKLLMKLLKL